jgi:hypothetical protein
MPDTRRPSHPSSVIRRKTENGKRETEDRKLDNRGGDFG